MNRGQSCQIQPNRGRSSDRKRFRTAICPKPQRRYWHGRGTVELAMSAVAPRVETTRAPIQPARTLLRPGTAACVAQVFLPAGSRDFLVPCSGPPRHRAQAIHHHLQSPVLTRREPDAPRESQKHGTGKSRVPADKNVGATTSAFPSRRRGRYARTLLRPGTAAILVRAAPPRQSHCTLGFNPCYPCHPWFISRQFNHGFHKIHGLGLRISNW